MSTNPQSSPPIAVIPIRYDGFEAEKHQLSLRELAFSLQGVSRLLSVLGHFIITGRYRKSRFVVRVVAREPRANCFSLDAFFEFSAQQGLFSGTFPVIFSGILGYVLGRNSKKGNDFDSNKQAIKASVKDAISRMANGNSDSERVLMDRLDTMCNDEKPALKRMVTPVGSRCRTITVADKVIDIPMADAIREGSIDEFDDLAPYKVKISALDDELRTCKLRFFDKELKSRIPGIITDPVFDNPDNIYIESMRRKEFIEVVAKAALRKGAVIKLYISDACYLESSL